ncbi:MAG: AsnC family transcriptional regulator [Candidatus Lokiarchaeota archaeon]|jgi:DNA-binding Lrp family transcriptional regulator|nr:AsnC family transcriptional regulator [Candidatus Lokiarchaeota archaeon]
MELDTIDKKIIEMLKEDGRRSYSEIAEHVDRTEVTVRRRVNNLLEEGVIRRFTIDVDPLKIGRRIRTIIRVKVAMKEASALAEKVKSLEEVTEAYILDGSCGLMLKVVVDNLSELRQFLENRFGNLPGVGEVETCIVLEDIKCTF